MTGVVVLLQGAVIAVFDVGLSAAVGGLFVDTLELLPQMLNLVIIQILQVNQARACALNAANQLIQLELDGHGVPVLCVLDEEDHQERDDGGAGIDRKLPGVGAVKERPSDTPDQDEGDGNEKRPR